MKFLPVRNGYWPPNIVEVRKVFAPGLTTIFAYGGAIWNPSSGPITVELFAHEAVHCERQGETPDDWWARYMADVPFRADEELLAHRAEYQTYVQRHQSAKKCRRYLERCATRLAGPLYGSIFKMGDAMDRIAAAS